MGILQTVMMLALLVVIAIFFAKSHNTLRLENKFLNQRLDTLTSLSASGFICTDMAGNFLNFNLSFSDMLDYSSDEIQKLDLHQITPEVFRVDDVRQLATLKRIGRYGPYRKKFIRKDGSLVDVELLGLLVHESDNKPLVWSQVSNISFDLRDREELLLAKDRAVAANLAKSEFLSGMSHELRTPLNGILGMAQLLGRPSVTDEQRIHMANDILSTGHSLAILLGELLDGANMDLDHLVLKAEPCQVGALLDDVVSLFVPTAAHQITELQVHWYGPTTPMYRVDVMRLRQMISNLVSHAVKSTHRGSIQVSGFEKENEEGGVVLEFLVQAHGVGTKSAEQHLETDVGLSIVQGLAQRMGGSLTITRTLGQGLRLSLLIQSQSFQPEELPELPFIEAGEVCCLVVDDNSINLNVIEMFLKGLDIRPISVNDGLQALNLIKQGVPFNCVLMDIHMPVMNGWLATQSIRAWELSSGKPRVPIIGLTAGIADHEKLHSLNMGMDDVLFKPIDLVELELELSKYLPILEL